MTKRTSPGFHNVTMNETNHINNSYRGYLQNEDGVFSVTTWADNIRLCFPDSVISERWHEGSCPVVRETLKPLSHHVLYKRVH